MSATPPTTSETSPPTEMLTRARQLGMPVAEVPVTHRPRLGGESKVSVREIPKTLRTLLRFWWTNVVRGPKPVPAATPAPQPAHRKAA